MVPDESRSEARCVTVLSALLRRLRAQQGLTLQEASSRAEITIGYLSDLERGRTAPSLAALDRLLAIYGHRLTVVDDRIAENLAPLGVLPRLLEKI